MLHRRRNACGIIRRSSLSSCAGSIRLCASILCWIQIELKQAGAAVKQYHSTDLHELLVRPMSTGEFKKTADEETGMSESEPFTACFEN